MHLRGPRLKDINTSRGIGIAEHDNRPAIRVMRSSIRETLDVVPIDPEHPRPEGFDPLVQRFNIHDLAHLAVALKTVHINKDDHVVEPVKGK